MPQDLEPEIDDTEHTGASATGPSRQKPGLSQDPHRVRELAERNLETAIGREVMRPALPRLNPLEPPREIRVRGAPRPVRGRGGGSPR